MQNGGSKEIDFIFFLCIQRELCKVKGTACVKNITNKLYYIIDLGENIFVDITHKTSKLVPKQEGLKKKQS